MKPLLLAGLLAATPFALVAEPSAPVPPYPWSHVITKVTWHWETRQTAAIGSDLWPVTWGPDDNLYLAWGDGGGFGGTDSDGRVSMGFARIEGGPEHFQGFNINGGKNPEHPSSFPKKGKTAGLLFDRGILYATVNLQDGKWPNVNHVIAWSADKGATWSKCDWLFPKGPGNFQPSRFVNFGKDGEGVPAKLAGFVYVPGGILDAHGDEDNRVYMARAPREKIRERAAYEFLSGFDAVGEPIWNPDYKLARPILTDTNGAGAGELVYDLGLNRYLLTSYHGGPGQLSIFESAQPWGPWSTVAYYEDWGGMGKTGEGLTCEFPQKWMSADGLTLWCIFSVYGDGAKKGIVAHDRFNLIKVTFSKAADGEVENAENMSPGADSKR